jgi:hypothetical protein
MGGIVMRDAVAPPGSKATSRPKGTRRNLRGLMSGHRLQSRLARIGKQRTPHHTPRGPRPRVTRRASARAANDREPRSPLRADWSVYELTHRAPGSPTGRGLARNAPESVGTLLLSVGSRRELELLLLSVGSLPTSVTCPLCSTGITPLPRYYGAVRPCPPHRYFRPRRFAAWTFSLGIAGQVLKFRTRAQMRVHPLHLGPWHFRAA